MSTAASSTAVRASAPRVGAGAHPRRSRVGARKSSHRRGSSALSIVTSMRKAAPATLPPESVLTRLRGREIGVVGGWKGRPRLGRCPAKNVKGPEAFSKMKLSAVLDLRGDAMSVTSVSRSWPDPLKIEEIVSAEEFIFGLSSSGVCVVFNRETHQRVGTLNCGSRDIMIRSLFYNKTAGTIITVSISASDEFQTLKCETLGLDLVRRGQFTWTTPLFEDEYLAYPGFVEFDDVNQKILTYSAESSESLAVYKIWSMSDYKLLYQVPDPDHDINEIKISPGMMLLIKAKHGKHLHMQLLDIETGQIVRQLTPILKQNAQVELVELFNDKLLIKQENQPLRIMDVRSQSCVTVHSCDFPRPSSFIFLYEKNLFITFHDSKATMWDFTGHVVTRFGDLNFHDQGRNNTNVFVTKSQDLMLAFSSSNDNSGLGSLTFSSLPCGATLHSVTPTIAASSTNRTWSSCYQHPLSSVTAVFYDEHMNEVYSGTSQGQINVWSHT